MSTSKNSGPSERPAQNDTDGIPVQLKFMMTALSLGLIAIALRFLGVL